jgi:hypothetical protein
LGGFATHSCSELTIGVRRRRLLLLEEGDGGDEEEGLDDGVFGILGAEDQVYDNRIPLYLALTLIAVRLGRRH